MSNLHVTRAFVLPELPELARRHLEAGDVAILFRVGRAHHEAARGQSAHALRDTIDQQFGPQAIAVIAPGFGPGRGKRAGVVLSHGHRCASVSPHGKGQPWCRPGPVREP